MVGARRSAAHRDTSSPDPLAGGYDSDDPPSPRITRSSAPSSLKKTPTTYGKRSHTAAASALTPQRRKPGDGADSSPATGRVLRGAAAPSPTPNRKAPVRGGGMSAAKPTPKSAAASAVTPTKRTTRSAQATGTPLTRPASAKAKGTPTLASSLARPLPTPSPGPGRASPAHKRPRTSASISKALTFEDDGVFKDPGLHLDDDEKERAAYVPPSMEQFRANEALRRQREARNFVYEGEASAPRTMRSGKVFLEEKKRRAESDDEESGVDGAAMDVDEYGGRPEEDEPMGVQASVIPDVPVSPSVQTDAGVPDVSDQTTLRLPEVARPDVQRIIATLSSRGVEDSPPPFDDEESNEALHGVVNLLKGTVERGEGNSAIVVGPRGSGKSRTVARAINLVSSESASTSPPIFVRLSGLAQVNDRLAIREMGRQIAQAEGKAVHVDDDGGDEVLGDDEEYAPTVLPSHLLALLTAPSPRAIIIILEEFDLFTEHARQALLYCLFDVVQSIKTGSVESTGRGVAVIGVTSRVDTLLLLEKRVKSRFSHRIWRVISPVSPESPGGWKKVISRALVPWKKWEDPEAEDAEGVGAGTGVSKGGKSGKGKKVGGKAREGEEVVDKELEEWRTDWEISVETLLSEDRIVRNLDRLTGLTTDVRILYRPFIIPMMEILKSQRHYLSQTELAESIIAQVEGAGWGLQNTKIRGLPHPAMGILIIAKHLAYAGREEFNFAQVEEEYLRFSRTKLVGSGKVRWPTGVLRQAFDHLVRLAILTPAGNATVKPQFAKVRCVLSPHEVVAWFKGEGANVLGSELGNWGRMMGGHV
ncbi:hypothetical protein IAT38_004643 [Cryptococcus sp. DSM 104549]